MIAHRRKSSLLFEPVAAYDFQNKVYDRSGNSYALTLENGATYTTDRNGNTNSAALFDGINDYGNIDSLVTPLASTTVGAWTAWVNPVDATPAGTNTIISCGDTSANEFARLEIPSTGILRMFVRKAGVTQFVLESDSAVFSDGVSTHVSFVTDGVSGVLYVDGVAVAQTFTVTTDKTAWISDLTGIDNFRIGDRNNNTAGETTFLDGSIDKLRIYNKTLTAEQIYMIYAKG
jgi:hypothetical protein